MNTYGFQVTVERGGIARLWVAYSRIGLSQLSNLEDIFKLAWRFFESTSVERTKLSDKKPRLKWSQEGRWTYQRFSKAFDSAPKKYDWIGWFHDFGWLCFNLLIWQEGKRFESSLNHERNLVEPILFWKATTRLWSSGFEGGYGEVQVSCLDRKVVETTCTQPLEGPDCHKYVLLIWPYLQFNFSRRNREHSTQT